MNPRADEIEGVAAYPGIDAVPGPVYGLSVVTPPSISEQVVAEALAAGIRHIWFQPGAESDRAIEIAREGGVEPIFGGPCVLVLLGFRDLD